MQKTVKHRERRAWYPAPISVYFHPSQRAEIERMAKERNTKVSTLIANAVIKALKLKAVAKESK